MSSLIGVLQSSHNLVVSARQIRKMMIQGVRPDFLAKAPLLEDVVRGMVEVQGGLRRIRHHDFGKGFVQNWVFGAKPQRALASTAIAGSPSGLSSSA